MNRLVSFDQAIRQYPNRFTMDHKPGWADGQHPSGRFYAPQYKSDREWYDNTIFPSELKHTGNGSHAESTNQSWPLGKFLDKPYKIGGKYNINEERIPRASGLASKQLRAELKKIFPDLRFTIRSHSYSMGSAMNVTVIDQSPDMMNKIREIVRKYEYGSFDRNAEVYNHDNKNDAIHQVKYAIVENHKSEEMIDRLRAFVIKHYPYLERDYEIREKMSDVYSGRTTSDFWNGTVEEWDETPQGNLPVEAKGSAHWSSYLVNGDGSGLDASEKKLADKWHDLNVPVGYHIVDCDDEHHFSWDYNHHTGDPHAHGGDLVTYYMIKG